MMPRIVRVYFERVSDDCYFTSSPEMTLKLAGRTQEVLTKNARNAIIGLMAAEGKRVTVEEAEFSEPDAVAFVVYHDVESVS